MREVEFVDDDNNNIISFKNLWKLNQLVSGTDGDYFSIKPKKGYKEVVFNTAEGMEEYAVIIGNNGANYEPELVMTMDGNYVLVFKKC